jgi:hypothetical protein
MVETGPSCPKCGSHDVEKLVLLSRKIHWGPFIRNEGRCPFREECVNTGSGRCNLCHREYFVVRHFFSGAEKKICVESSRGESFCQFKDKRYYCKTEPFIEVHWLFEEYEGE